MRTRLVLGTAAVALTVVPAAWSAGAAASNCGTVVGGGAKWSVVAAHVSCASAKPLVKKLAAHPHPNLQTPLGKHLGLSCIEYARKRTREIACVSTDGKRSVYGVTPPHK
jgi:hypothetical protein